ncbi:hypothetical protein [Roseovarius sp. MMSF_3281]|uniref:hypothetical protein n=1 Tax=Roseovarius sp. MMSF_3281 TaxID=3046694 RepID=UPI00273DCDD9|nr:hypothetical protein [Roseovarius sp. MMSF_3281]
MKARGTPTIRNTKHDRKGVNDMIRHCGAYRALLMTAILSLSPLGGVTAQEADSVQMVDPNAGFSSVSREYPDLNVPYSREGVKKRIARVRSVRPGMSRRDLQRALGRPAIGYGDGSLEFHVSLPLTGPSQLICQYRVFFDDDGMVDRAVWRRQQCANLISAQKR